MVDRGANGGLAGSDVRILSRSSRKCTVTGIDSHELQGLDGVQCAALVQTNHGIVNLIMNEYACYGKGHTIHASGQVEWLKNSVDDRSGQVGGKQRICTIDGYAMPLTCRGGLMYLSILGKPTDKDLERYPAVHLTGPHEWDPSVLDYTHPDTIYIKTQVFRLLRYYFPAPRNIARSDWATQNITHNMTSSIT